MGFKNMIEWKDSILASTEKKAMPLMAYPGLNILGKTVSDLVTNGEVQYGCIKALADKYPSLAGSTLVMALYVEAEAFGSKVHYGQNEIPTVSGRLIDSFSALDKLKIPEV